MGFNKKRGDEDESEGGLKFSPAARQKFADEMKAFGFDFDQFLLSKGAIARRGKGVSVLEYEIETDRAKYLSKFLPSSSPYYSFEASLQSDMIRIPFQFWSELRSQAYSEENRMIHECDKLDETRTGFTHEERAMTEFRKLSKGLAGMIGLKSHDTTANV